MIYKINKKNVQEAMNAGKRFDFRGLNDSRPIEIKFGISNKAEGSVSVKMGKTEVACGIKMGLGEPYTDHEDEGSMSTTLELLPLSSPNFEYGPPAIDSVEIARIIDRGIRESGFIDFKKLCIKEGEKVWTLFIDIATINDDGSLIDAGALAAVLALMSARFPIYDKEKETIQFGEFTDEKLPLNLDRLPLTTTFYKIGEKIFIDPTREEEDATEGRLTVEVSKPGKDIMVNAMQKGGQACFTSHEISTMVKHAADRYAGIRKIVDEHIEKLDKKKKK